MIRYATKEDAPRILQLIKDLAEYEKDGCIDALGIWLWRQGAGG